MELSNNKQTIISNDEIKLLKTHVFLQARDNCYWNCKSFYLILEAMRILARTCSTASKVLALALRTLVPLESWYWRKVSIPGLQYSDTYAHQ